MIGFIYVVEINKTYYVTSINMSSFIELLHCVVDIITLCLYTYKIICDICYTQKRNSIRPIYLNKFNFKWLISFELLTKWIKIILDKSPIYLSFK